MSKLSWHIEAGGQQLEGTSDTSQGIVRIYADVPAGTIGKITAVLHHTMNEDERLFMNGYQTWTYCPEYKKQDRQRGISHLPKLLVDKYSFDRYGDYHFVDYPKKRGRFHGFSYCYFRRGERFSLIASLDERMGYTIFRYDSDKGLLTIGRDCEGVEHKGGKLNAFDLYFAQGNEREVRVSLRPKNTLRRCPSVFKLV